MIKTIFFNLLFTRNILKYVSNRRLFSIPIILGKKSKDQKVRTNKHNLYKKFQMENL